MHANAFVSIQYAECHIFILMLGVVILSVIMLSVVFNPINAECRNAKYCYTECHLLNVIILIVIC